MADTPQGLYIQHDMLFRKWRPPKCPATEDWRVQHQIVVTPTFREELLYVAHEVPTGGHLGIRKTQDRILKPFFWCRTRVGFLRKIEA